MGHRLSKIYTRTGDAGTTGLGDGSRTPKNSARVAAMGDVDELNSLLGVILCEDLPADVRELFTGIQHDLFDLGGEFSIPGATLLKATQPARLEAAIDRYNAELGPLKEFILPGAGIPLPPSPRPTAGFAQPAGFGSAEQCSAKPCLRPEGGDDGSRTASAPGGEMRGSGRPSAARAAALTHLARTVCRRAERMTVALAADEPVSDAGRQYLNRLSDLLFVLGRWLNKAAGGSDVLWQKGKNA